ncbi:MAG TPA: thiopeptide-type bacteriocin biosynthesis protein, partial [Myxococcales bacterium]|nr:thiopeptide-type bacteriocin biosynthesis protein [Myxococcales bacterium]
DDLLSRQLAPLARKAVKRGDADLWFFIRYVDPAPHLRLRLRGPPGRLASKVLPALHEALEPLRQLGTIWKLELGTYEPEVERYGGPDAIERCERIFHLDSEAAVELLDAAGGDPDARWRFALLGLRALLADFRFSAEERIDLLRAARSRLASSLPRDLRIDAQLAVRYRPEREEVTALLDDRALKNPALEDAAAAIRRRSRGIGPHVKALRALERKGKLQRPLAEVASSVLHMHANRMFHSAAPHQELVLYDFMWRDAVSREKSSEKQKEEGP